MSGRWGIAKVAAVFLVVFALALAVQLAYWMKDGLTDESNWSLAAQETVAYGIFRAPHQYDPASLEADPAFLYPGTTIILPAALLDRVGVSPKLAMRAAFSFVMALLIALASAACVRFMRNIAWAVPAIAILVLGPFYHTTTLGSAATVPLFTLIAVLFTAIAEVGKGGVPRSLLWMAGIAGGIALATRFDMSAIFLGTGLIMLWFMDKKSALLVALISAAAFLACDPLAWRGLSYFEIVRHQMARQEGISFKGALNWAEEYVLPVPLGTLAFALAAIVLALRRRALSLPPRVVLWLMGATALTALVVLSASARRLWYFYPYFALWEILLLPLVSGLLEAMPGQSPRARRFLIGLLSVGLAFAFVYPVSF